MPNTTAPQKTGHSAFARNSLREAVDWIWISAAIGILFNSLHPSGIETKIHARKKTPPATTAPPLQSTQADYAGWNQTKSPPASVKPSGKGAAGKPPGSIPIGTLGLIGAQKAFEEKTAYFLDSRKPDEYALGHIPGAVSFYADEFDSLAPLVLPKLDPEKTYVIYCTGSECDLSHELARKLTEQGFSHLKIFFGGWPEWKKAGLPTTQGANP